MLIPLRDADAAACGGKAAPLGALLRAGMPVPDAFVVPFDAFGTDVHDALSAALVGMGDPYVAVRSSASDEDAARVSAAGRYDSFLAVRGAGAVAEAVCGCWASLDSPRATGADGVRMAVIVQRHLDAEVSGVMFTPTEPGGATVIEASWGLGPSVVGGTVTPDAHRVDAHGSVTRTIADKRTRVDRDGTGVATRAVPAADRVRPALHDATAVRLAALGARIAALLGGPTDVEWALADGRIWLLQARPVTAEPPAHATAPDPAHSADSVLTGTPGSRGTATGPARIVHGPGDFPRVRPGDILVCPYTDPAWTPLLRIAAGVVTATGGVLSHAAIVAREHAIPAVLGIPDALTGLRDGAIVTVDGTAGTVAATPNGPRP